MKSKRLGPFNLSSMAKEAIYASDTNFFRSKNKKGTVINLLLTGHRVWVGDKQIGVICGNLVDDVTYERVLAAREE